MIDQRVLREQQACLAALRDGKPLKEIASDLGLSRHQVRRRISGARKRERLDPELARRLEARGITDLSGLHSGWLLEKDKQGSGHSLYFYLGPDEEKISFVDAIMDVLGDIPRLEPIQRAPGTVAELLGTGKGYANWLVIPDLHVGGDYGDPVLEEDFINAIDDLARRMPPAEHAVLFELGDLLEANDHKGITPASGNMLEVRKEDHLKNTQTAVRLLRHALYRLLETHDTVEAHFCKGNHDETAFIAVMLALSEHFANNPRIQIHVSDADYRVISWGACAAFPNHGDKLKWDELKDVWTDQFPDEWARAKAHRVILTAHFHHDKKRDLVGCTAEHFRNLPKSNAWAKSRGMFSRGALVVMTVHRDRGEEYRTISNIRNTLRGA